MASVYTNDLRLEEIGSGEQSGTWGDTTNTNLELIAEAFSFGTEAITTNADTHTTTIADGATDPGRSIFLKYTGALDSACTVTLAPNSVSKLWFIENATTDSGSSGPYNLIISQGSGASVTIPAGQTKAVYSNGAGSTAAIVDAFATLDVVDLRVDDDLTVVDDATIGGTLGVTGVVTANAGVVVDNITIDGTEIDLSSGDLTLDVAGDIILDADGGEVLLKDGGTTYGQLKGATFDFIIQSLVDDKDIIFKGSDAGGVITSLTLDMSNAGAATFNSSVTASGPIQALGGQDLRAFSSDDSVFLSIKHNEIDLSSGDLTLDVAGDIILDADGADILLKHDGTHWGSIFTNATPNNLFIQSMISDGDIYLSGIDGGSSINALILDMSEAGAATFNAGANFGGVTDINGTLTVSPNTSGKDTFSLSTNAADDARLQMKSDTTTKVDIQANGATFFNGGNVGIGVSPTTAYGNALQIHDTGTAGANLRLTDSSSGSGTGNGLDIIQISNAAYFINRESGPMLFFTSGAEAMQIDSNGNVIIQSTGGTLQTATAGTSNFRAGVNAGNSIQSGGNYNTVIGDEAGTAITTGDNNTLIGYVAGDAISTSSANTAVGSFAMTSMTDGADNVAVGTSALDIDTKGSHSVAIGRNALGGQNFTTATNTNNTAVGYQAGLSVSTGQNNVIIGGLAGAANADMSGETPLTTGNNNVLIGTKCQTGAADADAQIAMGFECTGASNTSVTFGKSTTDSNIDFGATSITAPSDERYKENIQTSTAGLLFVNDLRPVTFQWKKEKDVPVNSKSYKENSDTRVMNCGDKTMHGFIAQEVKTVIDNHSEIKDGFRMWTEQEGADKRQRLAPSELVPILVKAIQELSAKNDALEARIATLEGS